MPARLAAFPGCVDVGMNRLIVAMCVRVPVVMRVLVGMAVDMAMGVAVMMTMCMIVVMVVVAAAVSSMHMSRNGCFGRWMGMGMNVVMAVPAVMTMPMAVPMVMAVPVRVDVPCRCSHGSLPRSENRPQLTPEQPCTEQRDERPGRCFEPGLGRLDIRLRRFEDKYQKRNEH